ncbi:MAG: ornithine carbamoyltransferase [Candidatus Latescibacteria bacterium]|nr:ornithine carbamoyltransferase [Candidatus Latescibacterota bacterium]
MDMDLLKLKTWSTDEILGTVEEGLTIKGQPGRYADMLEGKTLAMLFQKTSTRTRVSFEVGMHQLGGQAVFLDWSATNFGLADLADEAQVLSRYANVIIARMLRHDDLRQLASGSEVPVINGCCDRYHPCQALGDLLTILEVRGKLEGAHVVYVGVRNNVCNSLIEACTKAGVRITAVTPEVNEPAEDTDLITRAKATGLFEETLDLEAAVADADFIYTDTWIDMEFFNNPEFEDEKNRRVKAFLPYQINAELLTKTKALVMHCLPAHKGYEITGDVMASDRCIAVDQAENRMHSQKAVLMRLIGPEKIK